MAEILAGIDDLVDGALGVTGVGQSPHYAHKTSWLRVCGPAFAADWSALVSDAAARIESNWDREPCRSVENWRFEKQLLMDPKNRGEKRLEKKIAQHCGEAWANQVPTCSGINDGDERKRCIDLAHLDGSDLELIELKVGSGETPLRAALEILLYALLYRFSRVHRDELGFIPANNELVFKPERVELKVLATADFYHGSPITGLQAVEDGICVGLAALSTDAYKLTFMFEQFASEYPDLVDETSCRALIGSRRRVVPR